jgi:hypothetical protein
MSVTATLFGLVVNRKSLVLTATVIAVSLVGSDARAQWGVQKTASWGGSSSSSWSSGYGANGYYNTNSQNSNWYHNQSQSAFGNGFNGYQNIGYNVNTGGYQSSNSGYGYGSQGNWKHSKGSKGKYVNGNTWQYKGW